MKKINFEQMEVLNGGQEVMAGAGDIDTVSSASVSARGCKALAVIAFTSGVGTLFGPVGAIIFGPTAIVTGGLGLAFC